MSRERALQRRQLAVVARQVLDRADVRAVGLDGEHHAALDRLPVELHGAGAAVAGVAADVRAGQVEVVADEVHQQPPGRDLALVGRAVDLDRDRPAVARLAHAHPFARFGGGQHGALAAHLGEAPAVVGRARARPTGGSSASPMPATAACTASGVSSAPLRRSSSAVARSGTPETQPIATRTPPGPTRRGGADDVGAVHAERDALHGVAAPGRERGQRHAREQLALADGGHVDAEEEVVGRHACARRRARGS